MYNLLFYYFLIGIIFGFIIEKANEHYELKDPIISDYIYDILFDILLKKDHKNNYFINVKKFNSNLGTGEVVNTNNCNISVCTGRSKKEVIIISVLDNLIKGASGQAVQNMNIAFNFKESMGLI